MVLGRPPNLILGAFTAVFNVVALVALSQGIVISAELISAVNIAAAAVIALIAGTPPTFNPGDKYFVATPNGDKNITRTVRETDPNYKPGSADAPTTTPGT